MANYENEINSWPVLKNGLHYKWLVDYAAFSAFGTFELTAEEWEKRDLIVNFIQSISLIMINLFHFYDFQQVILTRLSDLNLLEYFQIVYV